MLIKFFQHTPCGIAVTETPVQQDKVDIICLQVFKRPVYGFSCGFGFKVIEIELCCQKKFVPCNPAFPDGIAYVFFISIGFSGINKAIACMDCREHAFFALLRIRDLKGAKSDHGHFHAVVQLNIFHKIAPFCS